MLCIRIPTYQLLTYHDYVAYGCLHPHFDFSHRSFTARRMHGSRADGVPNALALTGCCSCQYPSVIIDINRIVFGVLIFSILIVITCIIARTQIP